MKKHALAMIIGAAVALPGAAMADEGPKLYGKWNVSLERAEETLGLGATDPVTGADLNGKVLDYDGNTSYDQWELNSNASRIGVKGNKELDVGGLTATYKMEWEIDSLTQGNAAGGKTFKTRNSYVGLKHEKAGHFFVGTHDTPLKKAQGKVDQFGDTSADIKHQLDGEKRMNRTINWESNRMGGVQVKVQIQPGESRPELDDDLVYNAPKDEEGLADGKSVSVTYKNDSLWLAAARDMDMEADGITTTRLVAQVKAGIIQVGALVQQRVEEVDRAASLAGSDDKETDGAVISAAVKATDRLKLKIQHAKSDDKFGTAYQGISGANMVDDKREWTATTVGADYKLGKKTKVYTFLTRQEVDGEDDHAVGALHPSGSWKDKAEFNSLGFGLEHKF